MLEVAKVLKRRL